MLPKDTLFIQVSVELLYHRIDQPFVRGLEADNIALQTVGSSQSVPLRMA